MRNTNENGKGKERKGSGGGAHSPSRADNRAFPGLVWFRSGSFPCSVSVWSWSGSGPGLLFRSWSGRVPFPVSVWSGPDPVLVWFGFGSGLVLACFRSRYRFRLVPVTEGPTSPHQNEGTGFKRFRFGQGRQEGGQGAAPSDSLTSRPFRPIC
jgi:hypothetical protein